MKRIKPTLTIQKIGTLRFYVGVILGLGYGFLVNIWFRLLDRAFYVSLDLINKYVISSTHLVLNSYTSFLIALTSSSLGFCFTMYFWTSRPIYESRKITRKNRVANTNAIFIFMLILFVLSRWVIFKSSLRYDDSVLDIKDHFGCLSFILPLYIFLLNWTSISRSFKSRKFILFSAIVVLAYAFILDQSQCINTLITGLSDKEMEKKIEEKQLASKLLPERIVGFWAEERWVGVGKSNLPPPPPASFSENDTIWPPYYEISKHKIVSYGLGIDSTEIELDSTASFIIMKDDLFTIFVGYQKEWKILQINDSVMTIIRTYSKNYSISTESVRLIKR